MESMLFAQQKQDEYIKQLASKVDVLTTHNKMLETKLPNKLVLNVHSRVNFLVSPSLTLGRNIVL